MGRTDLREVSGVFSSSSNSKSPGISDSAIPNSTNRVFRQIPGDPYTGRMTPMDPVLRLVWRVVGLAFAFSAYSHSIRVGTQRHEPLARAARTSGVELEALAV